MTLVCIETLFLLFLIYSFTGWLIETIGDLIKNKKFINRGFLLGPYCPIYGVGVILITLLLSKYTDDIIALFFLSTILCGFLEYFTSYVMEKVFKARWWDYSKMKFNINGRICLETLVLFGIAGVLILHFSNPALLSFIIKIPEVPLHILSGILLFVFLIDCIISLNIMNSIKTIKVSVTNQIKDNTDEVSSKVREIIMEKSAPYRRFIAAFPQAFAEKVKEGKEKLEKTAEKVKENIQDAKERALDNLQDAREKALDNLQDAKERALDNLQDAKENWAETKSKVLDNLQEVKEKTLDNLENVKDKTISNIRNLKDKTFKPLSLRKTNNKKFIKNHKNINLSLKNFRKKY